MVHGDAGETAPNFSFQDIQRLRGIVPRISKTNIFTKTLPSLSSTHTLSSSSPSCLNSLVLKESPSNPSSESTASLQLPADYREEGRGGGGGGGTKRDAPVVFAAGQNGRGKQGINREDEEGEGEGEEEGEGGGVRRAEVERHEPGAHELGGGASKIARTTLAETRKDNVTHNASQIQARTNQKKGKKTGVAEGQNRGERLTVVGPLDSFFSRT